MHSTHRSRERRSSLRTAGTAALATVLLAAAGGAAATAAATAAEAGPQTAPQITSYAADAPQSAWLAAGSDGAMWSFEPGGSDRAGPWIVRYGRDGELSRVSMAISDDVARSPLTPQADGGMAIVVASWAANAIPLRVRVDARGRRSSWDALPRSARSADAFAIAADGTVWWSDTCADALHSWRPGSPVRTVRMLPGDCDSATSASALTLGPDGSLWYVNTRQGRVVRHDARGRVRQWNFTSAGDWASSPGLAVDPRGGSVAFDNGSDYSAVAGLVTRGGRLARTAPGAPAFAPDGTLWRAGEHGLVYRRSDGRWDALPLEPRRDTIGIALARDGRPWVTAGDYSSPPSSESYFHDLAIVTTGHGLASWSLGTGDGRISQRGYEPPPPVLGGDGALWIRALRSWQVGTVVRVVPPGLRAPRRPVARVTGLLARNGRALVLQVRCAAERGRFCRGTVGLGGSARAVRYVAPGQSGAAVSLTLTGRAAQRLRRRGALKVGAQVSSAGAGTTRATVRLRR